MKRDRSSSASVVLRDKPWMAVAAFLLWVSWCCRQSKYRNHLVQKQRKIDFCSLTFFGVAHCNRIGDYIDIIGATVVSIVRGRSVRELHKAQQMRLLLLRELLLLWCKDMTAISANKTWFIWIAEMELLSSSSPGQVIINCLLSSRFMCVVVAAAWKD